MEILSNKKFFIADDTTVIVDLHPAEVDLLRMLRTKYRFVEVTIKMRDGLPDTIIRITEVDKLGRLDKQV